MDIGPQIMSNLEVFFLCFAIGFAMGISELFRALRARRQKAAIHDLR